MRTYLMTVWHHSRVVTREVTLIEQFSTPMRARQSAIVMLYKIFGTRPAVSWGCGKLGQGQAWDKRGHRIELEQHKYIAGQVFVGGILGQVVEQGDAL